MLIAATIFKVAVLFGIMLQLTPRLYVSVVLTS